MSDLAAQAQAKGNDGEPVLRAAVVTGFVSAILSAAVTFGLNLSPEQIASIATVAGFLPAVVVGIWGRSGAFSPKSVVKVMNDIQKEIKTIEENKVVDSYLRRHNYKLITQEQLARLEHLEETWKEVNEEEE